VIPSRDGRELLESCLPRLEGADEVIVVDNGSSDGTADWLARKYPRVVAESSAEPLGFAAAVNRGLQRARFTHVCVLNNDMQVEAGFMEALRGAFRKVPDLFAATAQIFFPEGQRREETGKTVFVARRGVEDFPIRCDEPLESEDGSYVLYGSGGCTLYDAKKLAELGGFDPVYDPAYVEDLDLGVRAWQRGWPSVYCAGARVLHQHRATTSRFYSEAELEAMLERNFVRFLARTPGLAFRRLWVENTLRLKVLGKSDALALAARTPARPAESATDAFLELCNGTVAVFPGRERSDRPVVLIASPYLPFPLSHGAAVRIYNLMRRAARDFDLVLVAFVEESAPVPAELLEICVEVVTVRRPGTHALPSTPRPETVEEFDVAAYREALRQTVAKWRPAIVQLEFTQMAQYAADAGAARTILVEHDVTYDLYAQLLEQNPVDAWELRRQHERWIAFETEAWKRVDRVVTMSEKDRALIPGSVAIPNGVDLERFRPGSRQPDARRLLFIGSFAHRPNVLACEFFLRKVWPRLHGATLHIIAGKRHEQFWSAEFPGVEIEGFVADVRPAYERAAVVIAPLVASAGTNIKIMEAMAMGKAIVSTAAGIHGLELERDADLIVADEPEQMAREIERLLDVPEERVELERRARGTAERVYGWDAIAERQRALYEELMAANERE
jgi:GT2 family glycosyltransferase/glycosyltransferase involved in cell wall biosynthesis